MNVWIINHYAVPPTMPGGGRHYYLAQQLRARGHQAVIIASSFCHVGRSGQLLAPGERQRLEDHQGVPFLWLRTPPYQGNGSARIRNMVAFAWQLYRTRALRELPPPDVILGCSPHLLAALSAQRLARRYQIPFVMEVRDLWPQTFIDLGAFSPRHLAMRALAWLERHLYRRASRIVTLMPLAQGYIEQAAGAGDKVVWIPNGVDLDEFPEPSMPPGGRPLSVLYVGAHGVANALDTVLDAAALLQAEGGETEFEFRFVGDGPQKPYLQARAEALGLGQVRFEEVLPKQQVPARLQQADLLIVSVRRSPLYRWGLSFNKLFEYLAAARPIVFGGGESANDPVAEAGAGLTVPPEDPQAMAEALKSLAAMSPEERWEMGLRGRRYAEQHHDWVRLAESYEAVLQQAVEGRREAGEPHGAPAHQARA